jgi:DNA-binding response OmpR family regulator
LKKVLVIEDEERLQSELLTILEFEGYEAIGALNGRDGVLLAQEHRPDLIICDITMPVLDGFGVIQELRHDPQTTGIPVILLTGQAESVSVRRGLQLGAASFLSKPCVLEELLAAVKAQIGD